MNSCTEVSLFYVTPMNSAGVVVLTSIPLYVVQEEKGTGIILLHVHTCVSIQGYVWNRAETDAVQYLHLDM